jgi:hypothetical protein
MTKTTTKTAAERTRAQVTTLGSAADTARLLAIVIHAFVARAELQAIDAQRLQDSLDAGRIEEDREVRDIRERMAVRSERLHTAMDKMLTLAAAVTDDSFAAELCAQIEQVPA